MNTVLFNIEVPEDDELMTALDNSDACKIPTDRVWFYAKGGELALAKMEVKFFEVSTSGRDLCVQFRTMTNPRSIMDIITKVFRNYQIGFDCCTDKIVCSVSKIEDIYE